VEFDSYRFYVIDLCYRFCLYMLLICMLACYWFLFKHVIGFCSLGNIDFHDDVYIYIYIYIYVYMYIYI
jgi:hypothetical protein